MSDFVVSVRWCRHKNINISARDLFTRDVTLWRRGEQKHNVFLIGTVSDVLDRKTIMSEANKKNVGWAISLRVDVNFFLLVQVTRFRLFIDNFPAHVSVLARDENENEILSFLDAKYNDIERYYNSSCLAASCSGYRNILGLVGVDDASWPLSNFRFIRSDVHERYVCERNFKNNCIIR